MTSFGIILENRLNEAGQRPGKADRKAQAARQRILDRLFADPEDNKKASGFADPAAMFT